VFLTAFYSCGYLLDLRLFTLNVTIRSLFTEHQFLLYRLPFLLTLLLCTRTMRPSVANEVPKSIA